MEVRKSFEEMNCLDQEHLIFITKYLKKVLSSSGDLSNLYDIGTILEVNGEYGVVVGYCGVGYEYVLFLDSKRDKGYFVRGIPNDKRGTVNKISPILMMDLYRAMNTYLINNQFKLSTSYQKECYQHWLETDEYLFEENRKNNGRVAMQKRIDRIYTELKSLEKELINLD